MPEMITSWARLGIALVLVAVAHGQTPCPGFGTTGWASGGAGYVDYNSGCQLVQSTLYGAGSPQLMDPFVVDSASLCGQNCTMVSNGTGCNLFNWCSNPWGCCPTAAGCNSTSQLLAFGSCILRKQANLTMPSLSTVASDVQPAAVYTATQAQQWDTAQGHAAALLSSAHAFDSGICGNLTQQNDNQAFTESDFCNVVGADLPANQNFQCPGMQGQWGEYATDLDKAGGCHLNGTLEDLAAMCYEMGPKCSGFVYQSAGCCNRTDYMSSGWLKTGTITAGATTVLPYSTLYIKTGLNAPAPPPPPYQPPPVHTKSSNAGPIAGGVVGGVAAAVLLAGAVFAFVVRRRTGRWPLTKAPAKIEQQRFDSDQGAILINHQFHSTQSSRASTGASNSTAPSDEQDATTLLRKLQSTQFSSGSRGQAQGWRVRPNEIDIMRDADGKDIKLGEGGFGQVFKGRMNGVLDVAVKVLKGKQDLRTQQAFSKEIDVLSNARHPHVLQFIGAVMQEQRTFLVTEFMAGGDLWSALAQEDTEYQWHRRGKTVAYQIAQALAYLHTREQVVLHLDIKSQNVLLTASGQAKLADVGLARVLHAGDYTRAEGTGWTWAYASPEVIVGEQCGVKADVWSLGVLLWEIVTCEAPQRGNLRAIRVPEETTPEIDSLIWRCLLHDPRERPHTLAIVNILAQATGQHSQ